MDLVEKDTSNAYPDYDLHACVRLKDKKKIIWNHLKKKKDREEGNKR